jgi:hypothetical protein
MNKSKVLELYKGKKVTLFIIDGDKIRPRDGIFIDYDSSYIFLQVDGKNLPISFLRDTIKRIQPET